MTGYPGSLPLEDAQHVERVLSEKPFSSVNETQRAFLEQGGMDRENTLFVASTGNGKTLCAEFRVQQAVANGDTVAYLVPSKQLTSGKYESLTEWFDTEAVDIRNATRGETAGYTDADVIVATFESYFEAVLRDVDYELDLLIFDDFHELYSSHRGPTIEEGIAAGLYRDAEIFAMSATVGNPDEIARWMDANLIISPENRGVPITELPVELDDQKYGTLIADIIQENSGKDPFIVFNYRKSHTESRAKTIARRTSFPEPDTDYRDKLEGRIDTALTDRHETLLNLMAEGVAFHHADLDQASKTLVEEAVKAGDIRCVSATTTLAYGFDAPVHSVIVADLKRGWGFQEHYVGKWEYVQWIGRAGRNEERFDEAYAFPLYNEQEAIDQFEFGTAVEEKTLESIASHLGLADHAQQAEYARTDATEIQSNFRWLLLELICGGWTTIDEIQQFIQRTLYWQQLLQSVQSQPDSPGDVNPGVQQLSVDITEALGWLERQGFVRADRSGYAPTKVGSACFEFRHSTWVETTLAELLSLVEWIETQDKLTPESLLAKLADVYYDCNLGVTASNETFQSILEKARLDPDDEASHTAGIIAWFWTAGLPVDYTERVLEVDLSNLSSISQRDLAYVIDALSHLINATSTPEPPWLETFAKQLQAGVTAPDLYLTSITGVARGLVTNLEDTINSAMVDIETETTVGSPLIYKLMERWDKYDNREDFEARLRQADQIGMTKSQRIMDALLDWAPELEPDHVPPYQTTAREFTEEWGTGTADADVPSVIADTQAETSTSGTEYTKTSLDEFG